MIRKILFIQSFSIEQRHLGNEILVWEVYLENYLKSKFPSLEFGLVYLPIEFNLGNVSIVSYNERQKFYDQMSGIMSNLEFEIGDDTLIAISVTTSEHYLSSKLIGEFFQSCYPKSIIVFGGAHISARPLDFFYNNSPGDYIVIGEGEVVLYELIKKSIKKQSRPIILKESFILDLGSLPELDFSIFDKYIDYFSHLSISLSRGCPFKCNFCVEDKLATGKLKPWRTYSPKRAIKEVSNMIQYGMEHGIQLFGFYDPIFGMNKKWLEDFLDLYNYGSTISTWIETRLDILNNTILKKLIDNNFYSMFGLESYSKDMLVTMNKTKNPKSYLEKFEEIYDFHIKNERFFMINLLLNHPGENRDTLNTTFSRLDEMVINDGIDTGTLNIRFYHHFPGTHIYNNFNYFHEQFGSYVYYPEWFKKESLLRNGPTCVRPSINYSLRESFVQYTERYINLLNNSRNLKMSNRSKLSFFELLNIKTQIKTLIRKKKSILNFLNHNGIEMTDQRKKKTKLNLSY